MDPFVLLSAGLHYDKPKNKKPTGTHPQSHSVAVPLPGKLLLLCCCCLAREP